MRRVALLFVLLVGVACSGPSSGDAAACPRGDESRVPVDAPRPSDPTPPAVSCDPMQTATDPCIHWVACAGDHWALTWINGHCVGTSCVFTEPPAFTGCSDTCFGGPMGRCARSGPTAP